MCGILGYIRMNHHGENVPYPFQLFFHKLVASIAQRGPDTFGFVAHGASTDVVKIALDSGYTTMQAERAVKPYLRASTEVLVAAFRGLSATEGADAEPQPFEIDGMYVTHNGQISNSADIYPEGPIDSYAIAHLYESARAGPIGPNDVDPFLVGSWAYAVYDRRNKTLYLSRNYRGLHVGIFECGDHCFFVWSSTADVFHSDPYMVAHQELPLNTALCVGNAWWPTGKCAENNKTWWQKSETVTTAKEYLKWILAHRSTTYANTDVNEGGVAVVLSGGIDSTTAATWAMSKFSRVHFLHFNYGQKASAKEIDAFTAIIKTLSARYPNVQGLESGITLHSFFGALGGSTLTEEGDNISDGARGAEAPIEWVPARNTVFISMAAAYCDRHKLGSIILGLNMEEASVYPDNSIEFYERMQAALAIGAQSAPKLIMPLGNLMKRHIYKLAQEIEAPLHLSWSCYRGGEKHCGRCGSCHLRRQAALACGVVEDIYENG